MLPGTSTDTCDNTYRYHESLQLNQGKKTVENKHTTNLHAWFWSIHFNKTLSRIMNCRTMCNWVILFKSDLFPLLRHFQKIALILNTEVVCSHEQIHTSTSVSKSRRFANLFSSSSLYTPGCMILHRQFSSLSSERLL